MPESAFFREENGVCGFDTSSRSIRSVENMGMRSMQIA